MFRYLEQHEIILGWTILEEAHGKGKMNKTTDAKGAGGKTHIRTGNKQRVREGKRLEDWSSMPWKAWAGRRRQVQGREAPEV